MKTLRSATPGLSYAAALLPLLLLCGLGAGARAQAPDTRHGSCEDLAKTVLPDTKILSATNVPAGTFSPSPQLPPSQVSGFCRVSASLSPSADSDIQIELWLPDAWNGKYLANGIGGWGGAMAYPNLLDALHRGYATSATDTAFHRLFLVPGMGHCMGAYGVDWIDALDQWVEHGTAPAQGDRPPTAAVRGPARWSAAREWRTAPRAAAGRGRDAAKHRSAPDLRLSRDGPLQRLRSGGCGRELQLQTGAARRAECDPWEPV
jgi:hypothetical protein